MDLNVWIILGSDGSGSRCNDDQRSAYHYSGAHIDDWSDEGIWVPVTKLIRHTFLWFAVFIIGKGMILGNIIGLTVLLTIQNLTGLVKLDAQTYYVSTVPIEFNWLFILALNVATLLISVFMLVAPSYLISHIHPAKSMRYE